MRITRIARLMSQTLEVQQVIMLFVLKESEVVQQQNLMFFMAGHTNISSYQHRSSTARVAQLCFDMNQMSVATDHRNTTLTRSAECIIWCPCQERQTCKMYD